MSFSKLAQDSYYDVQVDTAGIRLEWADDHDADVVVGLFDAYGNAMQNQAVYFRRLFGAGGAIALDRDKTTGLEMGFGKAEASDETVIVNFRGLPQQVSRLKVAAIVQDQPDKNRRNVKLGHVQRAQMTVVGPNGQTLTGVDLDATFSNVPAGVALAFDRQPSGLFRCSRQFEAHPTLASLAGAFGEPVTP